MCQVERGQLVLRGQFTLAISVLTQDTEQSIVYLLLGKKYNEIKNTIQELIIIQTQKLLRRQGRDNQR